MDYQTVWFTKQKKVCDQLQDPALHRRIKKCLEERNKDPNLDVDLSREPNYGLMMLHILCPHSFTNNYLLGYEDYLPHPNLKIGSIILAPFTHLRCACCQCGIRLVQKKKSTNPYDCYTLVETVIQAINETTGAGIGGRQVEGLDKMTFAEAYQTFMKLSEFEEE